MWLTPDDLGQNTCKSIAASRRSITDHGVRNSSARVCPPGSVVLSTRAPIGHLAITTVPAATNQGCRTLIPNNNVESDFVYYSLLASRPELVMLGKGSTFMELTPSDLGRHHLPIPPLDEQRTIAAYLDSETARIDQLISKQELLIERLGEYRTALITQTVTKGLPPDAAEAAGLEAAPALEDSGVGWLGKIPEHWVVSRLRRFLLRNESGVWGEEPDEANAATVLRSTDQRVDGSWSISQPAQRSLSRKEAEVFRLVEGDLLLTKSSGSALHIGKTSIVTSDVAALMPCFSNFMQRLRCDSLYLPSMLRYVLNSPIGRQQMVVGSNTTTGLANLNASVLGEIVVPVPPRQEQSRIVEFLDAQSQRIDALRAKAEWSIERLQEYRSALVSAAVTGKIDVRDAVSAGGGV